MTRNVGFDSGDGVVLVAVDTSNRTVTARRADAEWRQVDIPLPPEADDAPITVRLRVERETIVAQAVDGVPVSLAPLTKGAAMRDFHVPPGVQLRRVYEAVAQRGDAASAPAPIKPAAAASSPRPAPVAPVVSVVVPSHNYATYLSARLGSIFAQTLAPIEIIVIDDASDDGSPTVALEVAAQAQREIHLVCGGPRSGNVFRQWRKAASLARGDCLWIAEADDICEPDFLQRLAGLLASDARMAFAFSDSFEVDAQGNRVQDDFSAYYTALGDDGLTRDGVHAHDVFLHRFLFPRNLVLNASAVVWRTQALREVFDRLGETAFDFTCAGDWRLYVEACQPGATIGYVAESLNGFRRHPQSVTRRIPRADHLAEIERILALIVARGGEDAKSRAVMDRHLADLSRLWSVVS